MPRLLWTACLVIALTASMMASAQAWPGKIVRVVDGDTVVVLSEGRKPIKVRLYGIDCPERRQPFGGRATERARELAALQTVDVEPVEMDRYGRLVAILTLPDGGALQEHLLDEGMAWVYMRYCQRPECRAWREREAAARRAGMGLWRDSEPTPPWMWRKARKEERH